MRPLLSWLWRLARRVLLVLAAVVMFVEEWGWHRLTAWAARIARWPPLAWLERRISKAPPRVALALFLVPALMLFPIKLLALWLINQGRVGLGVAVIVAAKLIGTAVAGRLFMLVEPQLMQFAWFVRVLMWWRATKVRVHDALEASAPWRSMRATLRRWRAAWRVRWRRFRG